MDDTITTIDRSEIEEAFVEVPEEVQNFMTSKAFDLIVNAIKNTLNLTDNQRNVVYYGSQELLLGTKNTDLAAKSFLDAGMTPEIAAKALYAVNTEILSRADNINEYFSEDVEEISQPTNTIPSPSTTNVLDSLKDRFTVPVTVAPITRQQGASVGDIIKKDTPPSSPRIDPYREIPK